MSSLVTAPTITLSEFPVGTVNPVFTFRTLLADNKPFKVTFKGEIVEDIDDPTSPAIAANSTYMGPVTIDFSSPVSAVSFDAGAFNDLNSTRIIIEGRNGFRVSQSLNSIDTRKYEHFSFDFAENAITRVRIVPEGTETAGFAVDNISVSLRPESREAELANSLPIDNLLHGTRWNGGDITYSFIEALSQFPGYGTGPKTFLESDVRVNTARPWSAVQQASARAALDQYSSVADLHFTKVSDTGGPGMMRFGVAGITAFADGAAPGEHPEAGDVWFRTGNATNPFTGSYTDYLIMHEIGHALGLKHPHDAFFGLVMPAGRDSIEFSVMSYRSYLGMPVGATLKNAADSHPQSLMMNDIAAIQHLYGANYDHRPGHTVYRFDPLQAKIFETVWDGGGIDRYDLSAYATDLKIDLNPGKASVFDTAQLAILKDTAPFIRASGNVYNARLYQSDPRSLIENATGGTGNDKIVGNPARNNLQGGEGNDTLDSLGAQDKLFGENGNDLLFGGSSNDQLTGGLGRDELTGGLGNDKFIFTAVGESPAGAGRDTVLDFIKGEDDINLAAIDANTTVAGDQAFQFIGTGVFTTAGQIRYFESGSDRIVSANIDADLFAELQILVHGPVTLTNGDFIL